MTSEIQEMIDELRKEGATYYQVRVILSSINEMSANEKLETLRQFLPPNEAVTPPSAPAQVEPHLFQQIEDLAARGVKHTRSNYPYLKIAVFHLVKWGLVVYLCYYVLWALSRFLNELVMKI